MNAPYICRTSTGKYHVTNHPNIINCNYSGQSRSGANRKAREEDFNKASPMSFCKKCFPSGKPECFF